MSYAYKIAVQQLLCVPTDDPAMNPEESRPPQLISGDQVRELSGLFGADDVGAKSEWLTLWDPKTIELGDFYRAKCEAFDLLLSSEVAP